ncbi:hypothetical protein DIPPA_26470 [Diplonema papillatum]|nr:hypothetical protein DIPPA_26470 [Diplonema papillatum]
MWRNGWFILSTMLSACSLILGLGVKMITDEPAKAAYACLLSFAFAAVVGCLCEQTIASEIDLLRRTLAEKDDELPPFRFGETRAASRSLSKHRKKTANIVKHLQDIRSPLVMRPVQGGQPFEPTSPLTSSIAMTETHHSFHSEAPMSGRAAAGQNASFASPQVAADREPFHHADTQGEEQQTDGNAGWGGYCVLS